MRLTRPTIVSALLVLLAVPAPLRAEDVRSDEGVSLPLPEGWTRRTTRLGPTTLVAIERLPADASAEVRATLFVNATSTLATTDDKAFQQAREYLPKAGEVVDRPGGKWLRVDPDLAKDRVGTTVTRFCVALREKKLYFFILTTHGEDFERDAATMDSVIEGAKFFPPVPKPASKPESPRPEPTKPGAPGPKPGAEPPLAEPRVEGSNPRPEKTPEKPNEPFVDRPPKKSTDNALVRTSPGDKSPDLGQGEPKPDGAAVGSPAVVKPVTVRQVGKTNVLGPKTLSSCDGELESDGRLAQNLVDPTATKPWCSSPTATAGRSKRIVFELARTLDVGRVAIDAGVPEESGFEGSGAREVAIQGASKGARGPWTELGRITLEKGKNDQAVDLPANEIRWLRVEVLSNHGHPTLTQLMKVRAFAAEQVVPTPEDAAPPRPTSTDEGPFRLERLKLSREKNGAPLEPASFEAGETFWVYFKPKALRLDGKGEYGLEVDLRLEDADGTEKLATLKVVDHRAKPPRPPLSPFVSLKVELPKDFPAGSYSVRLDVRDKESGAQVKERVPFEVKKRR